MKRMRSGEVFCKADQFGGGFQSGSYIGLIESVHRYGWLLMYLFSESSVLLRMSGMGYQNNAPAGLTPHHNNLEYFMKSLAEVVNEPYPPYIVLATQRNGEWIQTNTNSPEAHDHAARNRKSRRSRLC